MSNIYIKEPASCGKVLLLTTAGDIEIELWAKEAPLACRNFVQLCLESYYKGCVFHRVLPGFIAQGGDPTGTGEGGESIYGKPFKDEFHSRLRFVRRGLVAMANAGRDDNGSQFFFTLGVTKELDNKHTIFGKVVGDTVYNLPRFEEGEIGSEDRPLYPHKITGAEVLVNPFDDITPRLALTNEVAKENRKAAKKGVKNRSLLSFGDDEEVEEGWSDEEKLKSTCDDTDKEKEHKKDRKSKEDKSNSSEQEDIAARRKKMLERFKSITSSTKKGDEEGQKDDDAETSNSHVSDRKSTELESKNSRKRSDSRNDDSHSAKKPRNSDAGDTKHSKGRLLSEASGNKDELPRDDPEMNAEERAKAEESALRKQEIRRLKRELKGLPAKSSEEKPVEQKMEEEKVEEESALDAYNREKERYVENHKKNPKNGRERQKNTLALFNKFKKGLTRVFDEDEDKGDNDWMRGPVVFEDDAPVIAKDANTKDGTWYALDDPRHPTNQARRGKDKRKDKHA